MTQVMEQIDLPDLPVAKNSFDEMNASILQVSQVVDKVLNRLKNEGISTANGLSFLEIKHHTILSYLINLTYVMLRKCCGEKFEGCGAINRLAELRTVLEKIKPIDYKLKYQIDKLLKSTVSTNANGADASNYRANPEAFMTKMEGSSDEIDSEDDEKSQKDSAKQKKGGVYVPPKLAATYYDGDETLADKQRKAEERKRKLAVSSAILRELKEEYLDAPIEASYGSEKKVTFNLEDKRKIEYEENYMTRLPITKQEMHHKRQFSTLGTLGDELTVFKSSSTKSKSKSKSKNRKRTKGKKLKRL